MDGAEHAAATRVARCSWALLVEPDFAYRMDTAEVQAWIEETVGPALWAEIAP
jgi:hypothetical protein